MFAANCTACGRRELIFADQIIGLDNTHDGFSVRYTCWCGATQVWHADRVADRDVSRETQRVPVAA